MTDPHAWLKALHVMAVIAWMAAVFYLPRLFVYHSSTSPGSESSETFKIMEQRLARVIMTPAMLASWVFGVLIIASNPALLSAAWLIAKLAVVVGLSAFHGLLMGYVRAFAADERPRNERYFRLINEAPTVAMVVIVILVIVRPF